MTDGNKLIIRATDGHEVRIVWKDQDNETVPGTPVLEGVDVKVAINV